MGSSEYYSYPALTRYFDHIQTRPTVRKSAEALTPPFSLVVFDLDNAPKMDRSAELKRKEKGANENVKATTVIGDTARQDEGKSKKKEKKDNPAVEETKQKRSGAGKGVTSGDDNAEPVPSMIDLRVGHIVDGMPSFSLQFPSPIRFLFLPVQKHPDADGLYVEVNL